MNRERGARCARWLRGDVLERGRIDAITAEAYRFVRAPLALGWLVIGLGACRAELPPPDCAVSDGPRLDCGTVHTDLRLYCRDHRSPTADVVTRTPEGDRTVTLCEAGGPVEQALALPCDLPLEPARVVRASASAQCGPLPATADGRRQFEVRFDALTERVCGSAEEGSTAEARILWSGRLVAAPGQPMAFRLTADVSTGAARTATGADSYPACVVTVGDARGELAHSGHYQKLGTLDAADIPITIDCAQGEGLAHASCHGANEDQVQSYNTSSPIVGARVVLRVLLSPRAASDGGSP